MTITDFARLEKREKIGILLSQALLVDSYKENEDRITVYFLNGFFVELTVNQHMVSDIIPFKRGYRLPGIYQGNDQESVNGN